MSPTGYPILFAKLRELKQLYTIEKIHLKQKFRVFLTGYVIWIYWIFFNYWGWNPDMPNKHSTTELHLQTQMYWVFKHRWWISIHVGNKWIHEFWWLLYHSLWNGSFKMYICNRFTWNNYINARILGLVTEQFNFIYLSSEKIWYRWQELTNKANPES